jgi:hypothetical protein
MWFHGSRGRILIESTFSTELAPAHTVRTTQQFLAEFWTPVDLQPYSQDLNFLDFSIWRIFQEKVQVMLLANLTDLQPSTVEDWDTR